MGWERRRRGPGTGYYYRSVRTAGGGVKKVYCGRGPAGHDAAAAAERRKRGRLEARAIVETERDAADEATRLAADLRAWAAALVACWMISSGHHKHRGQWRRAAHGN